jgi:ribosome-associated toxin RatA of RatAB toxin-antitoxin module
MIWTWRRWYAVLLILGTLLTSGHVIAGGVDWDRLLAGEVVVETVQHPDGFPGLRASFTVTAARERIWAVLVDYAHFPQLFPDIQKMQVLAQDQDGAQVEFWIKALVAHYHYVLYRRYDEPGRRLTWTRIAGDFKRIEGSWEIRDTPRPGVHLLVYESYVDIGGVVPAALLRLAATRKARAMGERLQHWIKGRPMPE